MRIPTDFYTLGKMFFRNSIFLIFILPALIFISCTSRPGPYSVLEFSGNAELYNYSRFQFLIMFKADSASSTALLASDGDIITYGEYYCFVFGKTSRNKFSVRTTNHTGFINDKINSAFISAKDDMIPWFENLKTADISQLGFLYFDSIVPDSYVPYLTDLSRTKTDIGLGYDGDLKDMNRLFEIFKPGFLVGTALPQADFNILTGLNSLGFLSAYLPDSLYTIPLPAMPNLKHLFLTDVNEDAIKSADLLANNRQIERLTILGSGNFNLSLIEPLPNLKELIINGYDTILNFDKISDHKKLTLLSVAGYKSGNLKILKELPDIRWMTIYNETVQGDFESFIESHPDLEVMEIIYNDTITSLKSLSNLKSLYGLIVTDTLPDLNTIKSLKSLKYLSLPVKLLDDSTIKEDLQKSLPGTILAANQGICMGSGWLLLIIPLIAVFRVFARRSSAMDQEGF